jgi:hypothetical protein
VLSDAKLARAVLSRAEGGSLPVHGGGSPERLFDDLRLPPLLVPDRLVLTAPSSSPFSAIGFLRSADCIHLAECPVLIRFAYCVLVGVVRRPRFEADVFLAT